MEGARREGADAAGRLRSRSENQGQYDKCAPGRVSWVGIRLTYGPHARPSRLDTPYKSLVKSCRIDHHRSPLQGPVWTGGTALGTRLRAEGRPRSWAADKHLIQSITGREGAREPREAVEVSLENRLLFSPQTPENYTGWGRVGLQLFVWKIIQQLISNNTRINCVSLQRQTHFCPPGT